ncbi:hypothetical protein MGG_00410 [Pyricularia oryzae 70-15]|uniref:FAD dependent oxidoreductase domain-containing protein n=1 Tax=Pyricularia oryzae (strain 70-15 / ATCC MYA-4617 / FGSC 8958) TaxID=242507 RepID=G4NCD3_PYRO7|nr:uncharacterized protein MGG_00410 [Pyricularia oryzae 70-15]EHA49082.1 hypothetical protein MGG_00410 [Pyricularia oryzae 70-15]KAI6499040.1 hypothetical protein MCOR13_006415 [Pyricularia oryzae]
MEERGNIPVSLPVKNPTRSYWQDPPDQVIANLRSSPDLTQDADVVIIGSGITGAAIAWHLLQDDAEGPYPKVVMLEAREICSGATGRNAHLDALRLELEDFVAIRGIRSRLFVVLGTRIRGRSRDL